MTMPGSEALVPWYKKIFKLDFIIFAGVTLALWIVLLYATGHSIPEHSPHDQFTVQAMAWKSGKITAPGPGEERAEYKGNVYISFPPVPSFIEFPLTLIFNQNTPNTFTLLLFTWLSMLFAFFVLLKLTGSRTLSFFGAFSFIWGSQALYLSLFGAVWHQGQLYGMFFAMASLLVLLYADKEWPLAIGAFLLALAVGCRPYYLVMTVFYAYWAYKRFPKLITFAYVVGGLIPPGIFYAVYNYIRFDSIFEFGHKYIPWYREQPEQILGLNHLPQNLFYTFVNLPEWIKARNIMGFHGMGTGIWFVAPILLTGFVFFFKKGIGFLEKIVCGVVIAGVWFLLLLHDTNGWFQFGYRFSVDLIPLLLFFFGRTFTKDHWYLVPIGMFSVLVNIYGSFWFYVLNV
jgi:hypothetical protein